MKTLEAKRIRVKKPRRDHAGLEVLWRCWRAIALGVEGTARHQDGPTWSTPSDSSLQGLLKASWSHDVDPLLGRVGRLVL